MSHHLHSFVAENFSGHYKVTILAHSVVEAVQKAKQTGMVGPIVSPLFDRYERFHSKYQYLDHLAWLERKIAMKPPIDFSLLGSVH